MNGNHLGAIIVLLIVIAGGWFLLSRTPEKAPAADTADQSLTTSTTTEQVATTTVPVVATVTYTDQGFSPKDISIALGTTVSFVNQSTKKMWVASAKHPDHTVYSGTSLSQHCPDTTNSAFDECMAVASSTSFSFTFNKVGVWKYHNHSNPSDLGSVTVATTTSADTRPI